MSAARAMPRELDAAEVTLRERAAAAASEAELRQLWTVWRRLTLAEWRASPHPAARDAAPPWHRPPSPA